MHDLFGLEHMALELFSNRKTIAMVADSVNPFKSWQVPPLGRSVLGIWNPGNSADFVPNIFLLRDISNSSTASIDLLVAR